MKVKKVSLNKKKVMVLGLILASSFLIQTMQSEALSNFDFSLNIVKDELTIPKGSSIATTIFINLTSGSPKNIHLKGNWIGSKQPENVTVNLSSSYGSPPYSSNITFISFLNSEIGNYIYRLTAEGDNIAYSCDIQINITSNLILTLQTDNESYNKGQCILIFGNITRYKQTTISDSVKICLNHEKWKRDISTSILNNLYECRYNISYGDPKGIWTVTVEIIDDKGNTFNNSKNITVNLPPDIVRYNVVLFSPPQDAIYKRGNSINISVYITEGGNSVKNALTSCLISSKEKINLSEIKDGYYYKLYTIPWNSQIGRWSLSIETIKQIEDSLRVGGIYSFIHVKPATLNLILLEPSSNEFTIGEKINFKVDLRYPDGNSVENATVTMTTPKEIFSLVNQVNGIYEINYPIINENKGSWIFEISASDKFGNNVTITQIIHIIYEEQFIFPLITVVSVSGAGFIGFLVIYILWKRFSSQHLQNIQEEIQEIQCLQNEAAINYFKKGSISREVYDLLMKEHTEKLTELLKEEKKVKNRNF